MRANQANLWAAALFAATSSSFRGRGSSPSSTSYLAVPGRALFSG